jgi:hypothetical protein
MGLGKVSKLPRRQRQKMHYGSWASWSRNSIINIYTLKHLHA